MLLPPSRGAAEPGLPQSRGRGMMSAGALLAHSYTHPLIKTYLSYLHVAGTRLFTGDSTARQAQHRPGSQGAYSAEAMTGSKSIKTQKLNRNTDD